MSEQRVNLLNYDQEGLTNYLTSLGEKPFRAQQLLQWIYRFGVSDFEQMTNLSKALREKLQEQACIIAPEIAHHKLSQDGTHKWLLRLSDGNCIETVFIPEGKRGTLCISSQVGCALNCNFCATARQGFNRNLTVAEIIGQLWVASKFLDNDPRALDRKITNVVMMGMGEPLLNYQNVLAALKIMLNDLAYGLSKYRVTLSTSGVVPQLYELAKDLPVALAISLHAPNDELRSQLVPINKKYPLEELLKVCRNYYPADSKRHITFEYVMLDGVNDSEQHARQLLKILQGIPAKINLIPFNAFPNTAYRCSSEDRISKFFDIVARAGLVITVRRSRGDDVDAACGQLKGNFMDLASQSRIKKIIATEQALVS